MVGRKLLGSNMLWVCVDNCANSSFSGRIYSVVEDKVLEFKDFIQLVLLADELFDRHGFPQAFQKKRSFIETESNYEELCKRRNGKRYDSDAIMEQEGKLATFVIEVESRAHSEWQGRLLSTEFKLIQQFPDILDLSKAVLQEIR